MVRIPLDGHVNLPPQIGSTRNWLSTARSTRARADALGGNLTVPPRPADPPPLREVSVMSQIRLECDQARRRARLLPSPMRELFCHTPWFPAYRPSRDIWK